MALTYTPEAALGSPSPDFELPGVDGKAHSLADFKNSRILVIGYICNHCPYVKAVEDRIIELAAFLSKNNSKFIGICSNDAKDYPEDSFENLRKRWLEKDYRFPYLHDTTQEVAKAFGAVCTPDFFVYDENRKLVYRGRLDDSWKDPAKVQSQDLKKAVEQVLKGQTPQGEQFPSMGCSIKWKS